MMMNPRPFVLVTSTSEKEDEETSRWEQFLDRFDIPYQQQSEDPMAQQGKISCDERCSFS